MAEDKSIDPKGAPAATDGEVINLEDLVRDLGSAAPGAGDIVMSMSSVTAPPPVSEPVASGVAQESIVEPVAPADPVPPTVDEVALAAQVDEALAIEAPDLMLEVAEMRASKALSADGVAAEIDSENLALNAKPKGLKNIIRARVMAWDLKLRALLRNGKEIASRLARDSKGLLKEVAQELKAKLIVSLKAAKVTWTERIKRALALPAKQKLVYLLSVGVIALAGFTGYLTLKGRLLPSPKREWVASFTEIADGVFTYEESAGFEDFNDPLHHPEFVVLFDRIVVNLTRTEGASADARPMAAMELYIQTDNQDGAIELKDRKVEVQDTVSRAVERMTYPVLSSEEGKAKLKLLIRKELNEKLVKGRVRRVYLKTIVLNPEET